MFCLLTIMELQCLDRYRHIFLRRLWAPTDGHVLLVFALLLLGRQLQRIPGLQWAARYRSLWKSGIFYKLLKRL